MDVRAMKCQETAKMHGKKLHDWKTS